MSDINKLPKAEGEEEVSKNEINSENVADEQNLVDSNDNQIADNPPIVEENAIAEEIKGESDKKAEGEVEVNKNEINSENVLDEPKLADSNDTQIADNPPIVEANTIADEKKGESDKK